MTPIPDNHPPARSMPDRDPRAPTVYELDRRVNGLESEVETRFAASKADTDGRFLKVESNLDNRLGRIENKLDLVLGDRERLARLEAEVRSYSSSCET